MEIQFTLKLQVTVLPFHEIQLILNKNGSSKKYMQRITKHLLNISSGNKHEVSKKFHQIHFCARVNTSAVINVSKKSKRSIKTKIT